jgi:phage shock protein PspC (stress-responsive transcriptional regulator)
LDEAARRLAADAGKAEILYDLELAIAEKCCRFINAAKNVVTTAEIAQIIKEMGPVEGVGNEDKPAEASASSARAHRLYRIKDEAIIFGVCAGLAAYVGLDATIIRIIFALLTLFSAGSWVLVYILLVFLVPLARTAEQKATAYGEPFTAKEWVQQAKGVAVKEECCRFGSSLREAARKLRQERRERRAYMYPHGRFSPFSGLMVLIGMVASLLWLAGMAAIMTRGPVFGYTIPADTSVWAGIAAWSALYALVVVPLRVARRGACCCEDGPRYTLTVIYSLVNIALWAALACAVMHYFPGVRYFLNAVGTLFAVR